MIVSGAERSQGATATPGGPGAQSAAAAVHPLRGLRSPGPAIRVHGDYHLGQVMQTDAGWFVLDFEGEPARPLAERVAPTSPLKDVAGMLRSFDYAARFALTERDPSEMERATTLAASWEARNREAFVEGYRGATGISELLATGASAEIVLSAFELDKALYELDYERAYRPEWLPIPLAAIRSLLGRLGG
ncbi:MAG: maltokinase N-terminal cap-like domain-containing protein, partial [Acidimicrobiales bacterium]